MKKVVVITGALGGMGSAACRLLQSQDYFVIGIDNSLSGQQLGIDKYFEGDITNEILWREIAEYVQKEFGKCDALVNIAGINYLSVIEEADLDRWRRLFDVNVIGMVASIKHLTPLMRLSTSAAIVNMSSIAALIGSNGYSAYTASKGAIDSLTKALALELAPKIRINAVAPGWIETPFTLEGLEKSADPVSYRKEVEAKHALGRVGSPDEIANVISWLLSDKATFVTGTTVTADGGYLIKN
jgi:short-subunit dehydrogenase